jgi:biotin carboxylase
MNFRGVLEKERTMNASHGQSPHVLLIEPAFAGYELIRRGAQRGYSLSIITADLDERIVPPGLKRLVDEVCVVDTNNAELVVRVAQELTQRRPIAAVIPGFEYYVPTAATVARALNCRGLKPESAQRAQNKYLMRTALHDAGLRIPRFTLVQHAQQLAPALSYVGVPCVAKPVDFAGSIGVKKISSHDELQEMYRLLLVDGIVDFGHDSRSGMLLEEYIAGPEYSIEGYIEEDVQVLSITQKFLSKEPYFVELGHIVNAPLAKPVRNELECYIRDVLEALGVDLGPFHAEVRIGPKGPVLMEVGARLPGDCICELIEYATGADLYAATFSSYLGEDVGECPRNDLLAGIRYFIRPDVKQITYIDGIEAIKRDFAPQKLCIYHEPGTVLPKTVDFLDRLGYVILVDSDYQRLRDSLDAIDKRLLIQ